MRRILPFLVMTFFLLVVSNAQASEYLNIYIQKEAFLAHDVQAANIRIRPEGKVCVTRHSLWPWDEEGNAFSLFVEIENTSDEKIVLDEDWLYACKADREEIDFAPYALNYPTTALYPGEKVVVHAGVKPWYPGDPSSNDPIEGLSTFARRIRQAKILRLRFETRGNQSAQKRFRTDINANVWIEGRTLHIETTNASDHTAEYYSIGVIVSDREGRIFDLLSIPYSECSVIQPGQSLSSQKELQPYVTQDMIDGATFEVFAYTL